MNETKQTNPLTVRLWREVEPKLMEMMRTMGYTLNATINLLLMRGLGFGDFEIEEECKKNMRRPNDDK